MSLVLLEMVLTNGNVFPWSEHYIIPSHYMITGFNQLLGQGNTRATMHINDICNSGNDFQHQKTFLWLQVSFNVCPFNGKHHNKSQQQFQNTGWITGWIRGKSVVLTLICPNWFKGVIQTKKKKEEAQCHKIPNQTVLTSPIARCQ